MSRYTSESTQITLPAKVMIMLFWAGVLCVNTWAKSLDQLMAFQSVGFSWHASPDFWRFFYFGDFDLNHPYFIFVKLGHFTGFAIMDVLIYSLLKRHGRSAVISITFALFTEILQLYFGRDGRLYDLCIDSLGVLTVYMIMKYYEMSVKQFMK